MQKYFMLTLLSTLLAANLISQVDTIYYNSYWGRTTIDKAFYYRIRPIKEGEGYRINDHYISGAVQMSAFSRYDDEEWFEGKVTWYYESGKVKRQTEFKGDKRNGADVYYDEQGNKLSEGVYKNDIPVEGSFYQQGENNILSRYHNGRLQEMEEFDSSGQNFAKAHTKLIMKNGQSYYETEYSDRKGTFVGRGICDENGNRVEGKFVDYSLSPMRVFAIEEYTNGYLISRQFYFKNGQLRSLNYASGENLETTIFIQKDGKFIGTLISKDGLPYQGCFLLYIDSGISGDLLRRFLTYRAGVLNGPYIEYYNNGQVHEKGTYIEGYKNGEVTFFNEDGSLRCKGVYEKDKPAEGEFSPGWLYLIKTYKNGKLTATRSYYETGALKDSTLIDSISVYYNLEGKEIARLTYKDGNPYQGKTLDIDSRDGNISSESHYQKGILRAEKYYGSHGVLNAENIYRDDGRIDEDVSYYPNGEIMILTKTGEDYGDKYISYFDENGTKLGGVTEKGYDKNGEEYTFRGHNIKNICHYVNDTAVYEREYDAYGQMLYEIDYNGKASFYNQWGRLIGKGIYKEGKPYDGYFCLYENGLIKIKKGLKQGQLHGNMVLYKRNSRTDKNERVAEGHNVDGVPDGMFKEYRDQNLLQQITFKEGKKEGVAIFYDGHGNELSRGEYKNDAPFEGTFYEYLNTDYVRDSYVRTIEQYHEGIPTGNFLFYDYSGKLTQKQIFKNGELQKTIDY